MDVEQIAHLISTLGFPIVCVIGMAWFIWALIKRTTDQNESNMEKVQKNCKEREDRLYEEIKLNREVNSKAIDTIAKYAEKLDVIQDDIDDIKTNITVISTKVK